MASKLSFRSFTQILTEMIKGFQGETGINDDSKGSAVRSFFEAAALSDFRNQGDIIAALNSSDIDRAEGDDLDKIGNAKGVPRPQARASIGAVTFYSKNFEKISTKIYAGTAAPPAGSVSLFVADASGFPNTGKIYLGRGSNNVEGPISYSAIAQVGNYYQITLSTPTLKNHNVDESVVLAQGGNRTIPAGTTIQTAANATVQSVSFRTMTSAVIQDGELEVTGVPVVCNEVGTRGNVSSGAISFISGSPFTDAAVTNPDAFVTAIDKYTDPDYRLLIKNNEQTKAKATDLAIRTAAIGTTSPDDNKTVTSAQIVNPSNRTEPGTLYIDDKTAYQPIFKGQGFEQIIDSANGGEKYRQLKHQDITKALVQTTFTAPFSLTANMALAVKVGGVLYLHYFDAADFANPTVADTYEIVNSINANTDLAFSARASDNSKRVTLFAKDYTNEDLEVVVPDGDINANDYLGFSTNLTYSLRLYKNDNLLIKDGVIPTVRSLPQSDWSALLSTAYLIISVDQGLPIVYTFTDADFSSYGYLAMTSTIPLSVWIQVLNSKINGVTFSVESNLLKCVSNKGADSLAKVVVYNSVTANTIGSVPGSSTNLAEAFYGIYGASETLQSLGVSSDYTLNRSTGQIQFAQPLVKGDIITAGSKNTRAYIDSALIETGSINVGNTLNSVAYVILDAACESIPTSIDSGYSLTFTQTGDVVSVVTNAPNGFANVQEGDVIFFLDSTLAFSSYRRWFRIQNVVNSTTIEFRFLSTYPLSPLSVNLADSKKTLIVRTEGQPQALYPETINDIPLTDLANSFNNQLRGGTAKAIAGKTIRIQSNTFNSNGSVYWVGNGIDVDNLGFTAGQKDQSSVSHIAFIESATSEQSFPEFIHDLVTTDQIYANPSVIDSTLSLLTYGVNPNQMIGWLNPFELVSNNKGQKHQIRTISGTTVNLRNNEYNSSFVSINDRYHIVNGFNFDSQDNLVLVLDNDQTNQSFNVRMSRKGVVNASTTPTQTTFFAYDADGGTNIDFPTFMGDNFSFNDFKVHFKARAILDPSGVNNKMLARAGMFGPNGEKIRLGFFYPASPNSALSHSVNVKDKTYIKIYLASGAERLGGGWDVTTQFDVTNPSANVYRFTWNGTGTAPQFVTLANVTAGDIVNIGEGATLAADNKGIFKVLNVTDTYFEVGQASGVLETNKVLSNATDLRFYPLVANSNKASVIQAYVAANIPSYLELSQYESGAGSISASTFDDSSYSSEYVSLVDGENWVNNSSIGDTITPYNQFILKQSLQLSEADPDYSLVGEEFYLIPTNADHLSRFLNVFAITGLSSFGNLTVSSDAGKIQIFSNKFGSIGSVLVSGGSANSANAALEVSGSQMSIIEIESVRRTGTSVKVVTAERHNLSVSQLIQVADARNATFNGIFTISAVTPKTFTYSQTPAAINISSVSRSTNVVTLTSSTDHGLTVGDIFNVSGVTDVSFNGSDFVVLTAPTSTTITYAQAGANASSSGGSVSNVGTEGGSIKLDLTIMSIPKASMSGFSVGQWVKTQNTAIQAKALGFDETTTLQATYPNQMDITAGSGTFQTARTHLSDNTTVFQVEKQGDFMCIAFTGTGTAPNFAASVEEGDWVILGGNFDFFNQGTFKVEKIFDEAIYVKNSQMVEEIVTLSGNTDLKFYSYDSVMPGDRFYPSADVFNFSLPNYYTVLASPFPTSTTIYFDSSVANTSPIILGSDYQKISVKEKTPYSSYKKIVNIAQDPLDSNSAIVVLNGDNLANKNSIAAGCSLQAMSKLEFGTTIQVGEDSYKYYGGLIAAVGKKIRGQAADPVTYPGVAASGSYITIEAALPKRIQISLVVRNQTGINFSTIQNRIKTAVAAYVNGLGNGEPVVFSKIISEVQKINGVQAIAVSSPTYDSTHDLINVNYNQKAQIINYKVDVIVTQAT